MKKRIVFGSKRFYLGQMFSNGITASEAFQELRPKVAAQEKPWIFTRNPTAYEKSQGIGRTPKSMTDQIIDLQHEVNRAYAAFEKEGSSSIRDQIIEAENEPQEEKPEPIRAKGKEMGGKEAEKVFFFNEWKRLRRALHETAERTGASPLDSLDTMRPVISAKRLIDAGIAAKHLVSVMCLHWPEATRQMHNVPDFDFSQVPAIDGLDSRGRSFHRLSGYVKLLAETRENVMLIGPAGTGKSLLLRQVAEQIKTDAHPDGLPYAETPMTPGATRGDLLGRHTIEGFVESEFVKCYRDGGLFNFEEIDASDASMLIVVNNALASDRLYNSANGEMYEKHVDFIAAATANTFGLGSNGIYTGRDKLDGATIDRFRMARVLVTLDENLAHELMHS